MSLELVANNHEVKPSLHPDVSISELGDLRAIIMWTPKATDWVEENLELEPWQHQSLVCVVQSRFIDEVADNMETDGLVIKRNDLEV